MHILVKLLESAPTLMFAATIITNAIIISRNTSRFCQFTRKLKDAYRVEGRPWDYTDFSIRRFATIVDPRAIIDESDSPIILEIKKKIIHQSALTRDEILPLCFLIMIVGFILTVLTGIACQLLIGLIGWWQSM